MLRISEAFLVILVLRIVTTQTLHTLQNIVRIVTCYLGSQPIRRFIARQQLCKYATVMETLLGTRKVFSM
jgi:hypothetical protein